MIKNVAGYDLAKLFTGSFGTLGRHPRGLACGCTRCRRPRRTAIGRCDDPRRAGRGRGGAEPRAARAAEPRRALGGRAPAPCSRASAGAAPAIRRRRPRGRWRRRGLDRRRRSRTTRRSGTLSARRSASEAGDRGAGLGAARATWPVLLELARGLGAARGRARRARPGLGHAARDPARAAPRCGERWRRRPACCSTRRLDVRAAVDAVGPAGPGARWMLMRRVKRALRPARVVRPGALASDARPHRHSRLGRRPPAGARADRRLRALRLLPAHLPDLRALGRGGGLARAGGSC